MPARTPLVLTLLPLFAAGSVLQHPAFLQFWLARITTMMAYQMLSVAVGWHIYELTNRALDLGLIGIAQFLPSIVPAHDLSRAVAASATATQVATIAGPAVGGIAYALGSATVYGMCAVLYALGVIAMHRMRAVQKVANREPPTLASLFAGIAFIRDHPVMLGAITLDLFAVFLGGATALLPIYARDILHIGPWGLGVLRSATAAGALAMALWLGRQPLQGNVGSTMFAAVAVYGAATIVFGASTFVVLSFVALLVMGAADMVSVVIRSSIVQLGTPDDMRGRVNAVNTMFIGASNQLGEFESGVTAEWFGTVRAVVVGGMGTLAVVAIWTRLFPRLAAFDRFDVAAGR